MKFEQVIELIKAVSDSELTTFKYNDGDTNIVMHTGECTKIASAVNVAPQAQPQSQSTVVESVPDAKVEIHEGATIDSPLVGTFYDSPTEDAEPFVKVGDQIKKGQTLAIIEAMKLMNEIESECDGTITEILVTNGQGVEYGQPLFRIV